MKAIIIKQFGSPDVMKAEEVDIPYPKADEILVKVFASGVNPVDLVVRQGTNAALSYNLTLPLILGWDAAGIVEEVGTGVTKLKKGDNVYGVPDFPGNGSYAEYVASKAERFALKPTNLNFNQSGGVPLIALTAWMGLYKYGKLKKGQRVLVLGAAGGVGSCAVQFAKATGAYVIGVSAADDFDYLERLNVDEMIDYKTQKFEELVKDIDLVLEASSLRNNAERLKSINILKKGGILCSVNTDFAFDDKVLKALNDKGVIGELAANEPRQEWLEEISTLIEDGKVVIKDSTIYPLEKVVIIHKEIEDKRIKGKVVLEVISE